MEHKTYINRAIELACNSAVSGGGPFGCVIVKDNKVIGEASNSVTKDNDPTAHAEVNAIRQACKALNTFDLSGSILYTSCEPCPMCLAACYWAHISEIYYAGDQHDAALANFDDNYIYEEFKKPMEERDIKVVRIEPQNGKLPFLAWRDNENKLPY